MTEAPFDAARIIREADQDHAAARADASERLRQQLAIADAAMKALLIVNGGAMIALFTFVGNLLAKSSKAPLFDATALWWAFACFVSGLVLALLCHVCAFMSQDRFYMVAMEEAWRYQRIGSTGIEKPLSDKERRLHRQGVACYATGIILAILSVIAFGSGAGLALSGVLVS